jgi:nucleoside-diphosphate-sugar epimerase
MFGKNSAIHRGAWGHRLRLVPRMRLDVSVNMLTMQALTNGRITVFGGSQVRPNIHIDDITDLYLFLLDHPEHRGIYNAGFENLSIREIAERVVSQFWAELAIQGANDPRSYRVGPSQQLYRIIPRTVLFIRLSRKLQLHGGGVSQRSFIEIDDVADATERATREIIDGSEYNRTKMVAERVLLRSPAMVTQIVRPATVCGYSLHCTTTPR